jgi:hypothetical protein
VLWHAFPFLGLRFFPPFFFFALWPPLLFLVRILFLKAVSNNASLTIYCRAHPLPILYTLLHEIPCMHNVNCLSEACTYPPPGRRDGHNCSHAHLCSSYRCSSPTPGQSFIGSSARQTRCGPPQFRFAWHDFGSIGP